MPDKRDNSDNATVYDQWSKARYSSTGYDGPVYSAIFVQQQSSEGGKTVYNSIAYKDASKKSRYSTEYYRTNTPNLTFDSTRYTISSYNYYYRVSHQVNYGNNINDESGFIDYNLITEFYPTYDYQNIKLRVIRNTYDPPGNGNFVNEFYIIIRNNSSETQGGTFVAGKIVNGVTTEYPQNYVIQSKGRVPIKASTGEVLGPALDQADFYDADNIHFGNVEYQSSGTFQYRQIPAGNYQTAELKQAAGKNILTARSISTNSDKINKYTPSVNLTILAGFLISKHYTDKYYNAGSDLIGNEDDKKYLSDLFKFMSCCMGTS